jgi:CRP-like cAMP-binding protein
MSRSSPAFQNRVLAALPRKDLESLLLPHLKIVDIKQKQVIYDIGDPFDAVYFIEKGVASVLTMMEDGASIEVGMIGFEGIMPIAALLGEKKSEQHIVMQLPGSAAKISLDHCMAAFEKSSDFRRKILYFTNSFINLSAQTAACNRLHSVEQRLARWLLMSSDRFQSMTLPLTQEYISNMLGVRRVGVTETAGELQRLGLIRYQHGNITIVDQAGLKKVACECYSSDHERFLRRMNVNSVR